MAGRSEARIFASIWKDKAFRALPRNAQGMYLFLLSQPDLSFCGVIPLREPRWARAADGLTVEDVRADLKRLSEPFVEGFAEGSPEGVSGRVHQPFVVIDEESGELFVRSLIRNDRIWMQPNLLKAAREAATQVESPRILAALLDELRRIPVQESESKLVKAVMAEFIADLEAEVGNGSHNPPPKGSGNPSAPPSQGKGECNGSNQRAPQTPATPGPGAPPRLRAVGGAAPPTILGNQLLNEHLAACQRRPPRDVMQRTGAKIDALLDEGIEPSEIRAGLELMRARPKTGPGLLPDLVHEAATVAAGGAAHTTTSSGRRSGANVHQEHGAGEELARGLTS